MTNSNAARTRAIKIPEDVKDLSISGNVSLSARAAVVSQPHVYEERAADRDFAGQWQEAIAHFVDLCSMPGLP
jgi:hypothetical protein